LPVRNTPSNIEGFASRGSFTSFRCHLRLWFQSMQRGMFFPCALGSVLVVAAAVVPDESGISLIQRRAKFITKTAKAQEFDLTNVIHNNLGGFGPDSGAAEVRYGSVAVLDGRTEVDLVVTADKPSEAFNQNGNGNKNEFGRLNQPSGSLNLYMFSFQDSATHELLTIEDAIVFSFFDVDGNVGQIIKEAITVCGADSFLVSEASRLMASADGACTNFAPENCDASPNVDTVAGLSDQQLNHAFSAVFKQTSTFTVKTSITEGASKTESRPLMFVGVPLPGLQVTISLTTPHEQSATATTATPTTTTATTTTTTTTTTQAPGAFVQHECGQKKATANGIGGNANNFFAAIKNDGSVVLWGANLFIKTRWMYAGAVAVSCNHNSCAIIKDDGSVVNGGASTFSAKGELQQLAVLPAHTNEPVRNRAHLLTSGVVSITSGPFAQAAIKEDGSVVVWGEEMRGGDPVSGRYTVSIPASALAAGVVAVYATSNAMAALKDDGSVVTWGAASSGADSSAVASELASGVVTIASSLNAFAAIKQDGSLITWGEMHGSSGFNMRYGKIASNPRLHSNLSSGVVAVATAPDAFAALKDDGSVVTWGAEYYWQIVNYPVGVGGDLCYAPTVASRLSSGVVAITGGNQYAFAALKDDGSVVVWGKGGEGSDGRHGDGDRYGGPPYDRYRIHFGADYSESVADKLSSGVVSISATARAFAALKDDGSVVTWGDPRYGGDMNVYGPGDHVQVSVASDLASGVVSISGSSMAFAAIKDDGSVILWGDSFRGGGTYAGYEKYGPPASALSSGVVAVSCSDSLASIKCAAPGLVA